MCVWKANASPDNCFATIYSNLCFCHWQEFQDCVLFILCINSILFSVLGFCVVFKMESKEKRLKYMFFIYIYICIIHIVFTICKNKECCLLFYISNTMKVFLEYSEYILGSYFEGFGIVWVMNCIDVSFCVPFKYECSIVYWRRVLN